MTRPILKFLYAKGLNLKNLNPGGMANDRELTTDTGRDAVH